MGCGDQYDCSSCVAARNTGTYNACEWVMDSVPNFCHNWYDCANCYSNTATLEQRCPGVVVPQQSSTTSESISWTPTIGAIIAIVVACCICTVIAWIIAWFVCRKRGTNVSSLPNPTPQPQPQPQPQVQLQPKIIYVSAATNQPVRIQQPLQQSPQLNEGEGNVDLPPAYQPAYQPAYNNQ